MNYEFTPGSNRVLERAQDLVASQPPVGGCFHALLLGLLAEAECRAALMLADKGVDVAWVDERSQSRWADENGAAADTSQHRSWRVALDDVMAAAAPLLVDFPAPVEIATEHLLYGLVAGDHEIAGWLVQQGFVPETLRSEILQLHGYGSGPLDCEDLIADEEPIASSPQVQPTVVHEDTSARSVASPRQTVPHPVTSDAGALRVMDAAANRAREALRVAEDYVRFVLDDRHLTERLKRLRHRLSGALAAIEGPKRYASRETQGDVGTDLTTPSERSRRDVEAVATAALKRLGESLRTLEEFGKTIAPDLAASIEQMRYEAYTLEAAVHVTRHSLERLADARLYVLIDGGASEAEFARRVDDLVMAGVDVIQLRDKQLTDRELISRARRLFTATRDLATLSIINDRPDVAAVAGADGVHVGQDEMSAHDVRSIVGPSALVGVSTHSIDDARRAVLDGANYIGVGPTFPSETKRFAKFPGVPLAAEVAAEIRLPAFAIGGITPQNAGQVLATGIHGLAVSSAITRASNPVAAVAAFRILLAR